MLKLPGFCQNTFTCSLGLRSSIAGIGLFLLISAVLIVDRGGVSVFAYVKEQATNESIAVVPVSIAGFAYNPTPVLIGIGDTVTWTNSDAGRHTATSDVMGEFDSGQLNNGESASHTFNTAGTYDYHCNFHNFMNGRVVVAPSSAGVSVSGRVTTNGGAGLRNAVVTITGQNGEARRAVTSAFGYYRFEEMATGQTYIVGVHSKRFTFTPRTISLGEDVADLDFVSE